MDLFKGIAVTIVVCGLLATASSAQSFLNLPEHEITFVGNVRGYWFTAPVDFQITGLRVADEAGEGNQNVQLVRLNVTPPEFPAITTDFTSLFYATDVPGSNFIDLTANVTAGDIIGVLGQRGTTNSYADGDFISDIFGSPVTLQRLGTQSQLEDGPAPDLWADAGGDISRVEMRYGAVVAVPEPGTLALLTLGAGGLALIARRRKM